MSQEESPEDRQKFEFEALQAIYGNDIKDLRGQSAWNIWKPLNLCLSLTPQKGSSGKKEAFVQVDLHVICNYDYPNSSPTISLQNSKGLSDFTLTELQNKLNGKALELVGQEMIFQLSQYVEEFLHQHNKPPSKSFYDEMLHRRKIEHDRDLQAQQIEQDRQRQNIFEEVQQRQQILEMEAKKRREIRRISEYDSEDSFNRNSDSPLENSEENICNHKTMSTMTFGSRIIHRGRCTGHSSSGCVSYSGIDKESGELLDVGEWIFHLDNRNDLSSVQKHISSIEQELTYLLKLKHQNLAVYHGIKHQIHENYIIVNVVREFVQGSNCNSLFIDHNNKPDLVFLKHVAKEVLTALDYLHRNNVVHRDVDGQFVILSNTGIKLTNYSIYRRLSDLNSVDCANYSKKTDILKFGLFILSLVQGRLVTEDIMDIPNFIQSDLYDFLKRCLAQEESERFTASRLLSHSFFHKNIQYFPVKHEQNLDLERNTSPDTLQKIQHLSQLASGQSRLENEFEFLQHLGKGAFGDVIKVRNKLDGGYYAIKRIKLNPKNKSLNKKIIREVKLLSRLNHENVVRYYNSWIETTTIKDDEPDDQSPNGKVTYEKVLKVVRNNEFTLSDKIEAFSPIIRNMEISVSYDGKSNSAFEQSSDEDLSSSDEDTPFKSIYREESDSDDGIEFERDSKSVSDSTSSLSVHQETNSTSPEKLEVVRKIDFMYIQMEFCEKSTLRTAIDNNLFLDKDRVWRLFREIVEGLVHIHEQGMIHRDLKPVNIFLDSEDHVKIGDFGLATTSIRSKQNELILTSNVETEKEDTIDESKTGLVGTALYVAPEITMSTKVHYNQKVDIYSLGIILFEMFYRPLETSMERIKILSKLRMKETFFPEDFLDKKNEKQIYLIRWLLDHDISKRPTSSELLQSEHVPPPVLEERELQELVRHTLNNPHLKGYKYLIASCFTQSVTPAQNITYDKDPSFQTYYKSQHLYDFVRQDCIRIFEQHGAQNLSTPLLMPKSDFYDNIESCVKLMTHFGSLVCLPHDLRVPFARYIAWNGITFLRRYSVERVYREKKVFGFHPRELYECAFDIVTPASDSLAADAEILYIVSEIINEIPALRNKRIIIKLNHVSLLKSIFLHFGIKDNHQEVYKQISDIKEGKISKTQIQDYFVSRGLSDSNINQLLNLLNNDIDSSKAAYHFQMITKKKIGEAGNLARVALNDLKLICKNAESYGVEVGQFDIVISPGLIYNIQQYSGMICQFVCEAKKKHKHNGMEVLAAGGRYDSMVAYYRNMVEQASMLNKSPRQSAVGISISLDKMVQVIQREEVNESFRTDVSVVAVFSVGSTLLKEKIKILKSLRTFSIQSFSLETINKDNIDEQVNEINASHIIMLKENDHGNVRIKFSKEDRFQTFNMNELLENPKKILKISDSYQDTFVTTSIMRSDSKQFFERSEQNQATMLDIMFSTTSKVSSHARKRYDTQIRAHLEGITKKISGNVIVIGLPLEANVIKTLASHLEFENEHEFQISVETVIERHQRYRKDLNDICYEIYEQKTKKKSPTVILYSLCDNFYRVIM